MPLKANTPPKCNCPIWCYGTVQGRPVRCSLKTRQWSVAIARSGEKERIGDTSAPTVSISDAVLKYLVDCEGRGLAPSSIRSRQNVLERFAQFLGARDLTNLDRINLADLQAFRDSRPKTKPNTRRKEVEYVRFLFSICRQHRWIDFDVSRDLKAPKAETGVTLPYERDEIQKLLAACDLLDNHNQTGIPRARARARALLLLLLYSGMRISDSIKLKRAKLGEDGRMQLRTQKNGVQMYIKLHPDCVEVLRALPVESEYFLWSGRSKLSTAVGSARRTVAAIAKLAGVPARPHRFRDTFAIELLLAGEDIRTVQLLLGHESVKTTEKYYATYVARFQTMLDRATEKLDFGSNRREFS